MMCQRTLLFENGTGGYRAYTTPTLLTTGSGAILAIGEGRNSDPKVMGGDSGDIDLVTRRSLDGGRSWEPKLSKQRRRLAGGRQFGSRAAAGGSGGSMIHREVDPVAGRRRGLLAPGIGVVSAAQHFFEQHGVQFAPSCRRNRDRRNDYGSRRGLRPASLQLALRADRQNDGDQRQRVVVSVRMRAGIMSSSLFENGTGGYVRLR